MVAASRLQDLKYSLVDTLFDDKNLDMNRLRENYNKYSKHLSDIHNGWTNNKPGPGAATYETLAGVANAQKILDPSPAPGTSGGGRGSLVSAGMPPDPLGHPLMARRAAMTSALRTRPSYPYSPAPDAWKLINIAVTEGLQIRKCNLENSDLPEMDLAIDFIKNIKKPLSKIDQFIEKINDMLPADAIDVAEMSIIYCLGPITFSLSGSRIINLKLNEQIVETIKIYMIILGWGENRENSSSAKLKRAKSLPRTPQQGTTPTVSPKKVSPDGVMAPEFQKNLARSVSAPPRSPPEWKPPTRGTWPPGWKPPSFELDKKVEKHKGGAIGVQFPITQRGGTMEEEEEDLPPPPAGPANDAGSPEEDLPPPPAGPANDAGSAEEEEEEEEEGEEEAQKEALLKNLETVENYIGTRLENIDMRDETIYMECFSYTACSPEELKVSLFNMCPPKGGGHAR